MVRLIALGDTGSGKTLSVIDYLLQNFKGGYKIWTNIDLINIPYEKIESTSFIKDVDNTEKNAIFIDEVGEISKGYYQFNFSQLMAQSRKSIGENQVFYMTAQVQQQTNVTMRGMVDYIVYPQIIRVETKTNKPVIIKLYFYRKRPFLTKPTFYYVGYDLRNVHESCDYYDTYQEVEQMSDRKFEEFIEKYSEYVDSKGKLKDLTTRLHKVDGLNIAQAGMVAREIINSRAWGLID